MRYPRKTVCLVSVAAAGALALAACSSSGSGKGGSSGSNTSSSSGGKTGQSVSASYNAANDNIVNASTQTGGTVKYALSSTPDSFDPGNTYYAFVWDASRLWARALTTFKPVPGTAGLVAVPDLATSLGKQSDGGKTWTYTIRPGLKFSDGEPITTADVKYAIERSNYSPAVLSNGPTYFHGALVDNTPPYQGPYKDKSPQGLKSIETPNATTIVFHLVKPFADFDYLVSNPQSAPVPPSKDTGADYVKHIISSGSYTFSSYDPNKGAVLVKNPNWSAASDPLRKQYANEIDIAFNQEQTGLDKDLLAGNLTGDIAGAGVAASSQASIVNDPSKKANADDALSGALIYLALSNKVKPLDNLDCRKAVEYAVDKVSVQNAVGGPLRGTVATTVLPPNVTGYSKFDMYPTKNNSGDEAKAKSELAKCGHPSGFSIGMSVRGDRPNDVAAGTSLQASLGKVGIKVTIQKYPSGKYFSNYAGVPAFVHSHNIGLIVTKWGADWPTGYGFLDQIVDGTTIKASGNSNLSELNDPKVNSLLSEAIQSPDAATRNSNYGQVDKLVMTDAAIVPLIDQSVLLYRPPNETNVTVSASYGMYDYLNIGVK